MTLYMIGLGLGDEKDITIKGLEAIKSCDYIYLEHYTSILPNCQISKLEQFYEKNIIIANRELVEQQSEKIIEQAKDFNVAFLVVGDVFGATTHTDFILRAKNKKIPIQIINNASIINVVSNTGLELYKFGKTTSMVFFEENWKPKNVYETLQGNLSLGLHTLILLDIKIAESSIENIKRGIEEKLPPRFMSINQGLKQLLELESIENKQIISEETIAIGCARMGCSDELIKTGTIKNLLKTNFGNPVQCIIIPGKIHFIEEEAINQFS